MIWLLWSILIHAKLWTHISKILTINSAHFLNPIAECQSVKINLQLGRHFCSENLSHKFRKSKSKLKCCPYCKNPSRNLSHYILDCSKFTNIRNIFIQKINCLNSEVKYTFDNEDSVFQLFCTENPKVLKEFTLYLHELKTQFTK